MHVSVSSLGRSSLSDLDELTAESLCGGFWSQAFSGFPSISPSVSVGPTLFVAPFLRSSSNSFNFFGNRDAFNGSNNFIVLG
jgi:hypothetical protein